MSGNSSSNDTEPFPLLEGSDTIASLPTVPPPPPNAQRQQRRRSSAISGPNPAETPLTGSDQRLAEQIRRINRRNESETRSEPSRQSLPSLPFRLAYPETSGESSLEAPRTPTQETFPTGRDPIPTISEPEIHFPRPSRNRNNLTVHLERQLSPIPDTSGEKTPTRLPLSAGSAYTAPLVSQPRSRSGERTPTQAGNLSTSPTESSNNRG